MKQMIYGWIGLIVLLVGCEAAVTPIADSLPTSAPTDTPLATNTPIPTIRYGIADHTLDYLNTNAISAIASIEPFSPNADVSGYDVALAFGEYEGWQVATTYHLSLVINPNLAPMDNTRIREAVAGSMTPRMVMDTLPFIGAETTLSREIDPTSIKTTLANIGYPDGFELVIAYEANPALNSLMAQWEAVNLDVRAFPTTPDQMQSILTQNRAHVIVLQTATHPDAIPLLRYPLSYITAPDVNVIINEIGLPIVTP